MSTKPPPSKIDPELTALADVRGLNLGSFRLAGEQLFFVRRGEFLLLGGQSMTRAELVEFLKGGAAA